MLVYGGSGVDTSVRKHTYLQGPIAGAPGGQPVQVIYWGSWWNSPDGIARQDFITDGVQRLLSSVYFSWLGQYGIFHAPVFRGAIVTTAPEPPVSATFSGLTNSVVDLIKALLDDDVFPDPDDGPRFCFIVVMPDTFNLTDPTFVGAHKGSYDSDGPFDRDHFWVGWVRQQPGDPDETMRILCHELLESMVDPEGNGWRWQPEPVAPDPKTELCDGSESQTAFVNGVKVQAYWSNAPHSAPIIPIDNDYAAQLRAHVRETSRRVVDQGTFHPDNHLCTPERRECCFGDQAFSWYTYATEETAIIQLATTRFHAPHAQWTINGVPVNGEDDLPPLNVDMETWSGLASTIGSQPVTLHYKATATGLTVHPVGALGNFEIVVGCTVTDDDITGSPVVNVVAAPHITLDLRCRETLMEDAYIERLSRCYAAIVRSFVHQYKPTAKPGPGEPINEIAEIIAADLPAYVRPSQYSKLADLQKVARALHGLLPAGEARQAVRRLIMESPTLAALRQWRLHRTSAVSLPAAKETLSLGASIMQRID